MKIIVATKQTQGQRKNDFSYAEENELVTFSSECDGEEVDGNCGCRRAMSGLKTHKATTTVKVVEMDLTPQDFEARILDSMIDAGWGKKEDLEPYAKSDAHELIRLAAAFTTGSVLEKRGDTFQARF